MLVENVSKKKHWCTVCGKRKNPIIRVSIGFRTFYFCLKHAIEVRDEINNALKALEDLKHIRKWAETRGLND